LPAAVRVLCGCTRAYLVVLGAHELLGDTNVTLSAAASAAAAVAACPIAGWVRCVFTAAPS
jgi:hypothetical protein